MRKFISCETVLDEYNCNQWIDVESELLKYDDEYVKLLKEIAFSNDYPRDKFIRLRKVEELLHKLDWIKDEGDIVVSLEYFNEIYDDEEE